MSIEGARGILFTITGGSNLGMNDVNEAAKIITASADEDAKIIFGACIDSKMKDEIKITVVATGFDSSISGSKDRIPNEKPVYTQNSYIAEKEKEEPAKPKSSSLKAAQAEPAKKKEAPGPKPDDDDDELGIPAFIRKKMM